ncbi:hypothetical protein TGPRC2_273720 [Toxoplasma gondii TgCatPRC2]|uniref:Uncharacterized protein n=1 Tax=Toxoplasma gondii TgCatPRC2 TaxID=1130821 RepID=A0A151HPR9_TOXGO|nr:hypothetical protein TGPRC2_273720 [Toxoplasma gondii TgCatPRC2]
MPTDTRTGNWSSAYSKWGPEASATPQGFSSSRKYHEPAPAASSSGYSRSRRTRLGGARTSALYRGAACGAYPQLNRKSSATRLPQTADISRDMGRLAENCSVSSSNYATIALSQGVSGSRDLSTAVPKLKRDTPQKHLHNAGRNHFQGVTTTSQAALTILKDGVRRFGPSAGSEHMLRAEVAAAEDAIRTGLYSVWRNEHLIGKTKNGKLFRTNNGVEITDYHECFRIGPSSRCFCGHPYRAHPLPIVKAAQSDGEPGTRPAPPRFPPPCSECRCSEYRFIPDHPDAIAEPWLSRRAGFDVTAQMARPYDHRGVNG